MNFERDPGIEEEMKYARVLLTLIVTVLLVLLVVLTTLITSCTPSKKACDAYGNGKYYKSKNK